MCNDCRQCTLALAGSTVQLPCTNEKYTNEKITYEPVFCNAAVATHTTSPGNVEGCCSDLGLELSEGVCENRVPCSSNIFGAVALNVWGWFVLTKHNMIDIKTTKSSNVHKVNNTEL
eukprot:4194398-Amphidinium_carterae.1